MRTRKRDVLFVQGVGEGAHEADEKLAPTPLSFWAPGLPASVTKEVAVRTGAPLRFT